LLEVLTLELCVIGIADEKMDDKTTGSSKVDAVLHSVTFYPRSSHAGSYLKTVPDVQMKAAAHSDGSLGSQSAFARRKTHKTFQQPERCFAGNKCKVVERRPKSIESAKFTKSKYRLIRKPKYNLLPFKRGQLKLFGNAENVTVRNSTPVTLNSELAVEKENEIHSDNCNSNAVSEKRGGTSGRFFKATFGKQRQFTFNMRGLPAGHVKLDHLKRHERNTAVRNKSLCRSATSVCSKPGNKQISEEFCENDLPTVCSADTAYQNICKDAVYENTEVAVESAEADVENDSNHATAESNADSAVTNDCNTAVDLEQCSRVNSSSDAVDRSAASQDWSNPKLYTDSAVTSPSLKHGTLLCSLCTFRNATLCIVRSMPWPGV